MKNTKTDLFHMKKSIETGSRIQVLVKQEGAAQELVDGFRGGLTAMALAIKFNFSEKLDVKPEHAKQGVLYALKGYAGQYECVSETYQGLIDRDEYEILAKKHAHSQDQIIEAVKAALVARGIISSSIQFLNDEHKEYLRGFIDNPAYKHGSKYNLIKIISEFKEKFPDTNFSRVTLWKVITTKDRKNTDQ